MYTLKYAISGKEVEEITERLKQLSLAYQIEESSEVDNITLQEGKKAIVGLVKIKSHLEELATELHQWYYCNC